MKASEHEGERIVCHAIRNGSSCRERARSHRLVEIRNELRAKNLHDTEDPPLPQDPGTVPAEAKASRTANGEFNDLRCPVMGSSGTRFGRNVPLSETFPDTANLMTPSPRTVSQELFTREKFQPVTILNVMAAAWIQFQTHDWFLHRQGTMDNAHEIPLKDADPWPERPMRLPKTPVDPQKRPDPKRPPAYVNDNSHWWDGSQIYGSTPAVQATLRTGAKGKVKVGDDCRLGLDPVTGLEVTGMTENAWVALSLLHGLFALEHNAVCDRLAQEFPSWNDQQLFDKARLVVSALMAKIHTVEWTPAIMPHPIIVLALRTNWYGLVPGLQKVFPSLQDNEYLSGIPGSPTDHHTAPYSLTEEFVGRLPHALAASGRFHPVVGRDREGARAFRAARAVRPCRAQGARPVPGGRSPLFVRHLAPRRAAAPQLPEAPAAAEEGLGRDASTSPPWTSCATASAACRATTSSGGCSTRSR